MKTLEQHKKVIEKIAAQVKDYSVSHKEKKLRFYHGGTNSTRDQVNNNRYYFIDISGMNDVIEVNIKEKYALVEPNVSMDKLSKTTLQYGLLPPVIMEFPGITAGGAVNGATLEASSYKYGQFNDNCESYEIILGNGEVIEASDKQYADIFYGITGTYGSFGLITLIKVRLLEVPRYVRTTFTPSGDYESTIALLKKDVSKKEADFIDAIILSPKKAVVITGTFVDKQDLVIETFSKATDEWFYERADKTSKEDKVYEEEIPIYDFLFRYNRGAYWMGEYVFPMMHLPSDRLTKFIFNPFMNTRKLYDGLHSLNISQNYFIQDFYVPWDKTLDFLEESEKKLEIFPLWLCPIKSAKSPQKISPSYINDDILIDVGIWGKSKKYLQNSIGLNKEFEVYAAKVGARKMLYAHAYYSEEEFWTIYDKEWYDALRKKYYANEIFPNVWEKTHVGSKKMVTHPWRGALQMIIDTIQGKHLNS